MNKIKILVIIVLTLMLLGVATAHAGIGPIGFAHYAKQGIINENNQVYGDGHSPYNVSCQDHADYRTLTDYVTCQISLKK